MRYEILDQSNNVVNTIIAEHSFVETNFKGLYRLVPEPAIIPEEPVDVLKNINSKIDLLTLAVTGIKGDLTVIKDAVKK